MGISRPAVFLDRDGVINAAVLRNGKPHPPASLADLRIVEDAPAALEALKRCGFLLLVVTNQPDVARGAQRRHVVDRMHRAITRLLPLDDVLVCFHSDEDRCACRKPLPGLFLEAARRHSLDLESSFMIGDRWRDIDAGHNAGCRSILIGSGYGERDPERPPEARVESLRAAADWILQSVSKGARS